MTTRSSDTATRTVSEPVEPAPRSPVGGSNEILERTLCLLVPAFADYAFLHVASASQGLSPVAARHRDPELLPLLSRWLSEARERMTAPGSTIDEVFRDGTARVSHAGPGPLRRTGRDGVSVVDLLGPRTYLAVSVDRPEGRLGVLTLARFETERPYRPEDVPVVEAVAAQMALLVSAADREATSEEHLENLADQLIGVRESLAGELAAAREGLARARREREASDRARDQALEAARVAEEGREAAEAALAERSRREEGGRRSLECRMLDSVGEAVIATDLDGRTVFWNRAAEGLYGWSREEAIGRELGDTTPAVASKAQAVRAMDAIARGESWSGTIRVRRKDGSFVPVTLTGTPVFDGDGVHTGLIIVSSAASRAGGHESGVHDATATRARASESAVPSGLKSDQAEGEVSEGDPEPRAAETKTIGSAILVVEDDDSARELASRALREAGHDVFEAQDGVEALRIWEDERDHIGLVLTDVVMPRMSGRALVDRLRAQRPNLPALFMSAYAEDAVTLHGLVERDDPVLGKPLDRDALSTRVRELLERAALRSAS